MKSSQTYLKFPIAARRCAGGARPLECEAHIYAAPLPQGNETCGFFPLEPSLPFAFRSAHPPATAARDWYLEHDSPAPDPPSEPTACEAKVTMLRPRIVEVVWFTNSR